MHRVVIDTVVFVRSLINPHSWWGKVLFQKNTSYTLVLSRPVIVEILEVLNRPELTKKFKSLQEIDMRTVLDYISQAELVDIPIIPNTSRDPKDNMFLATAEEGNCHYIISEDRDLLDLQEYNGIQIITAEEFLSVLEK